MFGQDRPKVEPSAAVRQMAATFFGMYQALVDEGFTRAEALQLLSTTLAASIANNKPEQ